MLDCLKDIYKYEAVGGVNTPSAIDEICIYDIQDIEDLFDEYDIIEIIDEGKSNSAKDKRYTALIRGTNNYITLWVDSDFTDFEEVLSL